MSIKDFHIVKTELYDPDMMEYITKDHTSFSKSMLKTLSNYRNKRSFGNQVEVVYHYGKDCEENKIGRLYVKNNIGLQSFPRDIRNSLIEKFYWDIDMENCHYNLMVKMASDWNIPVENIKYYCEHRNECLKEVSPDRDIAKVAFLKVAYGGLIKLHDPEFKDEYGEPTGDLSRLKRIEKETNMLFDECYNRKKDEYKKLLVNKTNKKITCFALYCQTEERKCLLHLDEFFTINNRQVDILIHDGLEVRKLNNEKFFPEELLRGGEEYIKKMTGYNVKLVCKSFDKIYKPSIREKNAIRDALACKLFVKLIGNSICMENDVIYYFCEKTGLWSNKEKNFLYYCEKFDKELTFQTDTGKDIYYGSNYKNAITMRKYLDHNLENSNFISNNVESSIGKLLFKNGYYDFVKGKFYNTFDKNIVFLSKINRDFQMVSDEIVDEIEEMLFKKPFENIDKRCCKDSFCKSGEYLKKSLCMAIFGDYKRKMCYFGNGKTNSGKGLLSQAFQLSFEEYTDEFNSNNLSYSNSNYSTDEAKKLAWLKDFVGKRLVFSNEIRMDGKGFDGNLLKSIVSGGDGLKIRGNFEDQSHFVNRATLFILSNDMPEITPSDDALVLRCKCFKYNVSFVKDPVENFQRKADPNIKEKFLQDKYKNGLIQLMIRTYNSLTEEEKVLGGSIEEPKCVKIECKRRVVNEKENFMNFIKERYEITNNEEDYVPSREIIDYIKDDCDMKFSDIQIGRILSEMLSVSNSTKMIKGVRCRCGLKNKVLF